MERMIYNPDFKGDTEKQLELDSDGYHYSSIPFESRNLFNILSEHYKEEVVGIILNDFTLNVLFKNKETNKGKETNEKTSEQWNDQYKIRFVEFYGFGGEKEYKSSKVTKEQFLNMASNCAIIPSANISRRDAAAKLRELLKS